jgi:hypothetical protein
MIFFPAIGRSLVQAFQSFGDQIRSLFRPGPAARTPDPSPNFRDRIAAFIQDRYTRFADWLTGSPPQPPAHPEPRRNTMVMVPAPGTALLKRIERECSEYVVTHLDEKPWVRSPGSQKREPELRQDRGPEYWKHVLADYGDNILATRTPDEKPKETTKKGRPNKQPDEPAMTLTEEDLRESTRLFNEVLEEMRKEDEAAARSQLQPNPASKTKVVIAPDPDPPDERPAVRDEGHDYDHDHSELLKRVEAAIEEHKRQSSISKADGARSAKARPTKKVQGKKKGAVNAAEERKKPETRNRTDGSEARSKRTKKQGGRSQHRITGPALHRPQSKR